MGSLRQFFRRTTRPIVRRAWIGTSIGLVASLVGLPLLTTQLFQGFENKTIDARMRLRGRVDAAPEVVVCAIDARSVDRLGQWPWPRSVLAQLVDRLSRAGARAIAFDVVFSEPSRLGPQEDRALADAVERAGNVVLGYYMTRQADGGPAREKPLPVESVIRPPAGFPEIPIYPFLETNIDALTVVAGGGHFVVIPDSDGTVRHYSLILDHAGDLYPALALRAAQVWSGSPPISVTPYRGMLPLIGLGEAVIPASERGELWINFRGPFGETFAYHSVADVIEGRVPDDAFDDKLVFVGATETGIGDNKTSPFDVTLPGVEVHATVADNLLHRRFIRDGAPETLLGVVALLLLGPLCAFLAVRFRRPLRGAIWMLALMAAYAGLTHLVFILAARHLFLLVPLMTGALGYTGAAVWRNVFAERRAREIRSAFSQFVSKAVVQEMLADPDKMKLGGEKRELTVLFSDIRGFTGLSEKLPPEDVVALLNEYLTPMTRIVFEHGGTLDKYMGDAIMAFFGAPVTMPDHPRRACAAALAMTSRMESLSNEWSGRGMPSIRSGIGLNTGAMAVGNMGSEMIFDYTVIGDEVNLGARLEGLTRVYGVDIITSGRTRRQVGEWFDFRELDQVRVKGKQIARRIYELLGDAQEVGLSPEFLALFERGLEDYRCAKFPEARRAFGECARLRPEDGPTALYLGRLQEFAVTPPPAGWDGITALTSK